MCMGPHGHSAWASDSSLLSSPPSLHSARDRKEDGMGLFPENLATRGWRCAQRFTLPEKTQE